MAPIVVLHPGAMGASVAASLVAGGHTVRWSADGRSEATARRAEAQQLVRCPDLATVLAGAAVVVAVCPPHAAAAQAQEVAAAGFAGTYVDANAVAPTTSEAIGETISGVGSSFVDGGIVGPPAWEEGTTRLYLSGDGAVSVAELFAGGPLEAIAIGGGVGAASALKMCFAASTKAVTAVLVAAAAAARGHGVLDDLLAEWARRTPDRAAQLRAAVAGSAPKAWRFEGEMVEIGATFASAGVPSGALAAAADLYGRLADFKDGTVEPGLDAVLGAVLGDRRPAP